MPDIKQNIASLKQEIETLATALGRKDPITLLAVTKTHPVELIEAALAAGIEHIAENKVQEAMRKLPMIGTAYKGFHFIGHLQTNKINQLLALKPYLIHSIDSVYVAEKLHLALGRTNRTQDVLIQVNTTREEQKSGVTFENARDTIWQIAAFSTLRIKGLMTIGKLHPNPETSRPYFKMLKELFDEFQKEDIPGLQMQHLSMGMSHDWKIAIEEGSNMVRIGSAIFGERYYGDDI